MATQANAETAQKVKQSTVKSGQGQTENHVVAVPSRPEASQKATLNPAVAHNEKVSRISAVESSAEPVGRQQSSSERASAKDAVSKQVVAPTEKPLATDNARTKQLAANLVVEAEETSPASEVRLTPIALDQRTAQSAKALIDSGEGEIARRLLYDFIAEHEQDSASRAMLAKHLLQQQRVAEAGDVLAVVGPEDAPELKAVKARWLVVSGRMPEALTLLATDLPSVEQYTDYHALLASFYHQQQQFDRAVERYSALLEYDSNQADWWVGMGIGLDQLKRYEDAALAYRQALALPNLKQSLARFSQQRLKQLFSRQRSGA